MLKISILIDNSALVGRYLLAEPGLSLWIECGGKKILFDAGYSGAFLSNARLMDIDAAAPDIVVLSHGHSDHTWGAGGADRRADGVPHERQAADGLPSVRARA